MGLVIVYFLLNLICLTFGDSEGLDEDLNDYSLFSKEDARKFRQPYEDDYRMQTFIQNAGHRLPGQGKQSKFDHLKTSAKKHVKMPDVVQYKQHPHKSKRPRVLKGSKTNIHKKLLFKKTLATKKLEEGVELENKQRLKKRTKLKKAARKNDDMHTKLILVLLKMKIPLKEVEQSIETYTKADHDKFLEKLNHSSDTSSNSEISNESSDSLEAWKPNSHIKLKRHGDKTLETYSIDDFNDFILYDDNKIKEKAKQEIEENRAKEVKEERVKNTKNEEKEGIDTGGNKTSIVNMNGIRTRHSLIFKNKFVKNLDTAGYDNQDPELNPNFNGLLKPLKKLTKLQEPNESLFDANRPSKQTVVYKPRYFKKIVWN